MTTTVKALLEAGVHFGHQTQRWNPKMAPYLFGARAGVHIIDLEQTVGYVHQAAEAAKKITADGGLVLFVGTKRQGKEAMVAAAAKAGMPYVTERWLGGMLTNWNTIGERLDHFRKLATEKAAGDWDRLPKKEVARKTEELARLQNLLGGIKDLEKLPAAVYVNDVVREDLAVAEAKKLKLPIIGVVDSNADPTIIEYPIPANDDGVKAITVVADEIASACAEGKAAYEHRVTEEAEAAAKEAAAKAKAAEAEAAKQAAKEAKEAAAKEAA